MPVVSPCATRDRCRRCRSDPRRPFSRARAAKAGIGRMEAGCRPAHMGSRHRAGRIGPGRFRRRGKGQPICCQASSGHKQRPQASGGDPADPVLDGARVGGILGQGQLPAVGSVFAPRKKVCRTCVLLGQQAPRRPRWKDPQGALGPGQRLSAQGGIGPQRPATGSLATSRGVRGVMARVGYLPVSLRNSSALSARDRASIAANRSAIASDFAAPDLQPADFGERFCVGFIQAG
jgi:hypothetical protein